jgi:hypothetical protein
MKYKRTMSRKLILYECCIYTIVHIMHARARARARAHTHTHTHTDVHLYNYTEAYYGTGIKLSAEFSDTIYLEQVKRNFNPTSVVVFVSERRNRNRTCLYGDVISGLQPNFDVSWCFKREHSLNSMR